MVFLYYFEDNVFLVCWACAPEKAQGKKENLYFFSKQKARLLNITLWIFQIILTCTISLSRCFWKVSGRDRDPLQLELQPIEKRSLFYLLV
jgi:hypothetical protein